MTHKITQLCESSALTDLKLFQFGTSQYFAKNSDRSILGAHYVIHYVVSGIGSVRIGNGAHPISAGSVFVLFPNQVRQIIPDENEPLVIQWVELEGNVLLPEFNRLNLSSNSPMLPLHVQPGVSRTEKAFAQLVESSRDNEACQLGYCWAVIGALEEETAQIKPQRPGNQRRRYVEQAMDLIQKNYMHDITVEDIAEYCGLNRSYLGKLFRDETGKSTQEYLIEYRMEVACRYLSETTAPIGTIALSVGYQNQLHFSRAFRKTFGLSPRDWQKEQRMRDSEYTAYRADETDNSETEEE